MDELSLNIVEFIRHAHVLNDQTLSVAQLTCLKAIYGLPLDAQERELYERATGRSDYLPIEQNEATVIVGRRGGKTSKIAAPIACYEAFCNHRLSRGERGYVMLIAPVKYQAEIAFRYIRAYVHSSPLLRERIKNERRGELEFKHGISIVCFPCSHVTIRGVSVVCAICDEVAFWRHEETAANPEEEVLDALRPAMATFPRAKLIKISTPYRKEGILWREYQQRAELDHLVWQLPSPEMNPTLQPAVLERAQRQSEEKFRREYLAEFTESTTSWIEGEVLDSCIVRGRRELPRVPGAVYVSAIDPAFVRNDFALAITHLSEGGTIVLDRIERWCGTKKAPLGFELVCEQVKRVLGEYNTNSVVGDQYCAPVIRQELLKLGIYYEDFVFGSHTRAEIFGNLKHLVVQRRIELLDNPELLRQLRSLEEQKTDRGQVDIRPSGGTKDDLAVAAALATSQLVRRPSPLPPMRLGIVECDIQALLHMVPGSCPYEAICANSPRCMDEGSCQGFADERVRR
jgi:hypothetical protein